MIAYSFFYEQAEVCIVMSSAASAMATTREEPETTSSRVATVIEIIGTSNEGWKAAARVALEEAKKTVHNIHGIKVQGMTADVDPDTDRITR